MTGTHAGYHWLTSDRHTISDIVKLCPDAIIGRYLAVTSTDSGEPRWAERLAGWSCRGSGGYSPRIESLDGIVYQRGGPDSAGFDEWWTFESPHDLGEVIRDENPWDEEVMARPGRFLAFVNFYFYPDERHRETEHSLWPEFWGQIVKHQPESYISDGEVVTFVTKNPGLFEAVRAGFATDGRVKTKFAGSRTMAGAQASRRA
jgi:hypothetical protein